MTVVEWFYFTDVTKREIKTLKTNLSYWPIRNTEILLKIDWTKTAVKRKLDNLREYYCTNKIVFCRQNALTDNWVENLYTYVFLP